jgi:hypothetical protein
VKEGRHAPGASLHETQQSLVHILRLDRRESDALDPGPLEQEVEQAGDVGFIICISGKLGACVYQHAIDMQDNFFEDGCWYLHGAQPNKTVGLQGDEHEVYKVHGWMLPPVWEG